MCFQVKMKLLGLTWTVIQLWTLLNPNVKYSRHHTPETSNNFTTLQEQKIGWNLFDRSGSESNDNKSSVPSDALQRWNEHANRIIDYVSSMSICDLCGRPGWIRKKRTRMRRESQESKLPWSIWSIYLLTLNLIKPLRIPVVDSEVSSTNFLTNFHLCWERKR